MSLKKFEFSMIMYLVVSSSGYYFVLGILRELLLFPLLYLSCSCFAFFNAVNHAPPPTLAQQGGGGSLLGGIGSTIAQGK